MTAIWKRTWREGERDRATEEKEERAKKMEGGAEGGRKKGGGAISGWKWLRSPLVLPRQPKPTTFDSSQLNRTHFHLLLLFSPPCLRFSLKLPLSSFFVFLFLAIGHHSFAFSGSLAALRRITRWIAKSETPYILFRVGRCSQRPELWAVTWASSWLSFTPPSLMRPDSWGWSYSSGWMLCW